MEGADGDAPADHRWKRRGHQRGTDGWLRIVHGSIVKEPASMSRRRAASAPAQRAQAVRARSADEITPIHRATPQLPACIAEGLGTFALVFAGCGAIMTDQLSGGKVTLVGVGLVFGLVIAAMVYATGHISGAHLNPAVTLGFVLARHFPPRRLVGYWLAQLAGATAAALSLRLVLGNVAHLGATAPAGSGGAWQSFALEALLTFFLMFVIMAVATDTRAVGQAAALAIGPPVGLEARFPRPVSGASMDPAPSVGSR